MFEYVKDRNRKQITTENVFRSKLVTLCLNMSKIEIESKSQQQIKQHENNPVVFEYVKDRNRKQITTSFPFLCNFAVLCLNMSKIEIESKSQH